MSTDQSTPVTESTSQVASSNSVSDQNTKVITREPGPVAEMEEESPNKEYDSRSSYTLSQAGSGYEREDNECVEFCLDFCTCFGTFDTCCPSNGEGCLSSAATFCGNIFFGMCKC